MKILKAAYNSVVLTQRQLELDTALTRMDNTLEEIIHQHSNKNRKNGDYRKTKKQDKTEQ